jgi:signal transduction histidine kinase
MPAVAEHEVSRHKCLIYDGHPSEQLPIVVPLLLDGLKRNRRCMYLGAPDMVEMLRKALSAADVDVVKEVSRGALVLSCDRSHLKNGRFDPDDMVAGLCAAIDQAVRDGFEGLCASGDMRWELGEDQNFDRLREYEAKLDQLFKDRPLNGVCQYHRDTVPSRAVRDALLTHRSLFIGQRLNEDNLFYVPPEILLDTHDRAVHDRQADWMWRQIVRISDAEEQRDQSQMALERANEDLELKVRDRTAELQAANEQLDTFNMSVSHDLRAPLRTIDGFSRIVAEDYGKNLDPEALSLLGKVRSGAGRMNQLIDDLLAFSRMGRQELRPRPVDMDALVREVFNFLPGRRPDVEFIMEEMPPAQGDVALLRQVWTNLLANALKYTGDKKSARITVGGQTGNGELLYWVQDDGAGFDMRKAGNLFGVFQRLHGNEFEGTGVGLAIVKRIVGRHGGRVWAESEPNKGARFHFTLPAR